jgi:paraquat-inducible protein B
VNSITQAADSIKEVTADPAVRRTLESLPQTVANLDKALTSIRTATDNLNQKINPAVTSFVKSSEEANATMKDTRATLVQLQATLDSDSPLAVNINTALEELADTTRSVGELTNYLQRNPGSLVRGKYVPEKDR